MDNRSDPAAFKPTVWSVILRAANPDDPHFRTALNNLCSAYWKPVYLYVRRKGVDRDRAQDLVQGFFADFIERGCLGRLQREGGSFRKFLLECLANYAANVRRTEGRDKRGGGVDVVSLDVPRAEAELGREPEDGATPESIYLRSWARTTLTRAFDMLYREFEARDQLKRYEILHKHLAGDGERVTYEALGEQLSMKATEVRDLLHRTRVRLRHFLREAIQETVQDAAEVEDEMRTLLGAL